MKLGLYTADELSNSEYHEITEDTFYSSSQLKTAIEDMELFHKKYITKEIVQQSIPAFDIGTYYHTAILEPEKLEEECAVFHGKMRRGKEWDVFKEEHNGKAIITAKEYESAKNLIVATQDNDISQDLLSSGSPEVSLGIELMGLQCKVRADWIDFERGFILDLKSTTGNAKDEHKTKGKVGSYDYDLSAAFYLDCFNTYLQANGLELLSTFYWVFASKDFANCQVFSASQEMLEVGRRKYKKAIRNIKEAIDNGWVFEDTMIELDALPWDKQLWLEEKEDKRKHTTTKTKVRQTNDGDLL